MHIGQTGFSGVSNPVDARIFFLGGGPGGVPGTGFMNVAVFDPSTNTFTSTVTVAPWSPVSAPAARVGLTAAHVRNCGMSNPAAPEPCIVVFGGAASTGLLNDAWALWYAATPAPRWQRVIASSVTPAVGQPTLRRDSTSGVSSDGTTVYIYGGVGANGPLSDVYALAPAGFSDPLITEMTNVARTYREVRNSTTWPLYSARGAISPVDGIVSGQHDATGYSCTHSRGEFSPWWGLRLNSTQLIGAIRIIPRSDGSFGRMRLYRMFLSSVDPNPGVWPLGGPPTDAQLVGPLVDAEVKNGPLIVDAPVTINLPVPKLGECAPVCVAETGRVLSS